MIKARSIAQIALMTALMTALSFLPPISLGFIPVPIVLQNLGIMLAASLLGARRGSLTILIFFTLGLVLPVFTRGRTTLEVLLGPTAGYVLAWALVPAAYATLKKWLPQTNQVTNFLNLLLSGVLLVLLIGSAYLAIYNREAFYPILVANLIFLPGDLLKALITILVTTRLRRSKFLLD